MSEQPRHVEQHQADHQDAAEANWPLPSPRGEAIAELPGRLREVARRRRQPPSREKRSLLGPDFGQGCSFQGGGHDVFSAAL
jgi:hypothetical protein